mmetsp:Transcript_57828/g.172642  ORF Transcript_57828/g.172642 Transcript_57828/m.172642 type:complete len:688 (-) Transcript_57828:68-2131(-)
MSQHAQKAALAAKRAAAAERAKEAKAAQRSISRTKSLPGHEGSGRCHVRPENFTRQHQPVNHWTHNRRNFELSAEDHRSLHGQLYAYINRLNRNPSLSGNCDPEKIQSLMSLMAEVFSDSLDGVSIGEFSQQTELEDRYGAFPILMRRAIALEGVALRNSTVQRKTPSLSGKEKEVALCDSFGEGVSRFTRLERSIRHHPNLAAKVSSGEILALLEQASKATSLAASTTYEAINIAEIAKKNSKATVSTKMAWSQKLGELRTWAESVRKISWKAEDSLRACGRDLSSDTSAGNRCQRDKIDDAHAYHAGSDGTSPTKPLTVSADEEETGRKRARKEIGRERVDNWKNGTYGTSGNSVPPIGTAAEINLPVAPTVGFSDINNFSSVKPAPSATATKSFARLAKEKNSSLPPATESFSWEERIQHLLHFKAGYGHCDIPLKYNSHETPGLGHWVARIRRSYVEWEKMSPEDQQVQNSRTQQVTGLTDERINQLEENAFRWRVAPCPLSWAERLDQLRAFKAEHGHTMVPRSYSNLGDWCKSQRMKKKVGDLDKQRVGDLEAIGFEWCADRGRKVRPWEERFELLVEFRRRFGSCDVSADHNVLKSGDWKGMGLEGDQKSEGEDCSSLLKSLRRWSTMQRTEYRKLLKGQRARIDKAKIKKLLAIGFDFEGRPECSNDAGQRTNDGDPEV